MLCDGSKKKKRNLKRDVFFFSSLKNKLKIICSFACLNIEVRLLYEIKKKALLRSVEKNEQKQQNEKK